MKQKDIVLFVVVGIVSAIFAVLLSRLVIGTPESEPMTAEIVEPIVADFQQPDDRYFNTDAVNPTQLIEIKDQSNNRPFN
jgi:hypothetical protein